jgi:hypothetical protein
MMLLLFAAILPRSWWADIVHATTGMTSLLHFRAGNVDMTLVGGCSSDPSRRVWVHLSTRVPMLWLRRILCAVLLVTGARMLWA